MGLSDSLDVLGSTSNFLLKNTFSTFNHLISVFHYLRINQLLQGFGGRGFILRNTKLDHEKNLSSDKFKRSI